ncbi:MAG TPA: tryptophan 7-halogenase [Kofleriaceae bacterium]|nr:tryptophan 7-halogenase [Kofleriaceae bacterium]
MNHTGRFDVAILGSGLAGSILAAILARNGLRTLLIEQTVHPRFAIGESTVPETTFQFRVLAYRYGIPELANLSTYNGVRRHIGATSGVKRNFSFVYHRPGRPQNPLETTQFPTLAPPFGPDVHLFRQDVDGYLLTVAASYGAIIRQRTDVIDVKIDGSGVHMRTRAGELFEAEYVVDAGGIKAPIAQMFGLRENPTRMKTNSRAMYTHMIGVTPFDACMAPSPKHGLPSPLSQGTLHHLFDRGWMWVIPFNNHPSSTNRLCSVGLCLDPRHHPNPGVGPEEEFRQFVSRYPALARQFEKAVAIREWTAADRLQFSSTSAVGDRYCLIPHAWGFVDPLFSSGLGIALGAVNMLAHRLIRSKQDGDWSTERFAPIDTRVKRNFAYFDKLVAGSYISFRDFDLWNAWFRVWMIGSFYGGSGVVEILGRWFSTNDTSVFEACEQAPYNGIQTCELPEFAALLDACAADLDAVDAGQLGTQEAAGRIYQRIDQSQMWPAVWGGKHPRPEVRHPGPFTIDRLMRNMMWIQRSAPEFLSRLYRSFRPGALLSFIAKDVRSELEHSGGALAWLARDYVRANNRDWKRFV